MNKEEWLSQFEEKFKRKPSPVEFFTAKKNNEFEVENLNAETTPITEVVFNSIEEPKEKMNDEVEVKSETSENIIPDGDYVSPNNNSHGEEYVPPYNSEVREEYNFCAKCGTKNFKTSEYCVSCGSKINSNNLQKSFLSDISEKFFEVSSKAGKKTKELTQSIQTNTQLYKENKKREKLILTLGNAYYESRKNTIDDPFSELINEIKEIDILIQNMKNSE
ncbi:hypothetical protein [Streptococcus sp. HMSC076C09]|uniref:hypothetical protein n=1 Tax=Streptococcus sp. HMSC076C09 TaxID=1715183 RepID=UPI0008AA4F10|nr:hypothetical protein [Streptococcus sp. HMSC076C09]OHQ87391.1 hypothetical protein HMPREF2704_09405 [Streptococcus sp. HMSC076C09]